MTHCFPVSHVEDSETWLILMLIIFATNKRSDLNSLFGPSTPLNVSSYKRSFVGIPNQNLL